MPCAAYLSAISLSTPSSISPELRPGAGTAVISAAVRPLKRRRMLGPPSNEVRISDESGTMSPSSARTCSRPMSSGRWRNGACASACTR